MSHTPSIVPAHIAIIMDGNGRWAEDRDLGRTWGHREGAKRVDDIVSECRRVGVKFLTLYAFSTENWNRPAHEVTLLMRLLVQQLKIMDSKLIKNKVKLVAQGNLERLPKYVQLELQRVIRITDREDFQLILNLSLSYGGRQEIVDATRKIAEKLNQGLIQPEALTESTFREFLYQPTVPDPDLLIRTGGEYRVSNFLLWEIAYSEIIVTPVLWPDFHPAQLNEAIEEFNARERRFGKTSAQIRQPESSRGLLV